MKRIHIVITTLLLFLSTSTHAMKEIASPIENPTHVKFLSNATVAIGGTNGFCIHNIHTQKTAHFQPNDAIYDMCDNPSKTRLAVSCNGIITIYDIKTPTDKKTFDIKTLVPKITAEPIAITFNSQNEHILFMHDRFVLIALNTTTDTASTLYSFCAPNNLTTPIPKRPIICHPLKEEVLFNSFCDCGHQFHCKIYTPQDIQALEYITYVKDYILNAVGSLQAIKVFNEISSKWGLRLHPYPYHDFNAYIACDTKNNAQCTAMAFHPQQNVLATLFDNHELHYWDCKKINWSTTKNKDKIKPYRTITLPEHCKAPTSTCYNGLSFSPNGKYLILALQDRCILRNIAWDLCSAEKQKSLILVYWALRNQTDETLLPQEIIQECIRLLHCYKK